jgi:hypothetical protein
MRIQIPENNKDSTGSRSIPLLLLSLNAWFISEKIWRARDSSGEWGARTHIRPREEHVRKTDFQVNDTNR